jgi:DNA-binding transcriptional ArsR family regulator
MVTNHEIENDVFRALADPTRRAILDLLRRGEQPVNGIARTFPVSRPAISKHLRQLREAQLVTGRKDGREQLYRLNPVPLGRVDEWLAKYRQFWQQGLTRLKRFAEAEERRKKK